MLSGINYHRWLPVLTLVAIWVVLVSKGRLTYSPSIAEPELVSQSNSTTESTTETPRILIVYSYTESKKSRENLRYFVKFGLHRAADFIFIFNGRTDALREVPERKNVQIVMRERTCSDLGGHGEVLRGNNIWKQYDYFVLLNASVRGPFMPYWSSSCWSDMLLAKITHKVKQLVGITAKCWPRFYIPSMVWATDQTGIGLLLDASLGRSHSIFGGPGELVGLSGCYDTLHSAAHAEMGATSMITGAGYTVDVLMTSFHKIGNAGSYCIRLSGSGRGFNDTECATMAAGYPKCNHFSQLCDMAYDGQTCKAAYGACKLVEDVVMNKVTPGGLNPYDDRVDCVEPPLCGRLGIEEITKYLNQAHVQKQIGVKNQIDFKTVNIDLNEQWSTAPDLFIPTSREVAAILDRKHTRVLVINGNNDIIVNTEGVKRIFDDLLWRGQAQYRAQSWANLHFQAPSGNHIHVGMSKTSGNLTVVTVDEAGHIVPHDQPEAVMLVVKNWAIHGSVWP
ncbi:hypothetical protein CcaCcLH18_11368 [Colletotrichum camelliae]|nr:hypothetical protein CcaCcLH18_11368 [Colletotrichum camelliae]